MACQCQPQEVGVLTIVMNCILLSAFVGKYTDGEKNLLLLHSTWALPLSTQLQGQAT